jgi:hypothetical protein
MAPDNFQSLFESWSNLTRFGPKHPLTQERLEQIFEATCVYGSANCWTGTTGMLAGMIRELLVERERLLVCEVEARSINKKGDQ